MKNSEFYIKCSEKGLTNRLDQVEKIVSSLEVKVGEIDHTVKENFK